MPASAALPLLPLAPDLILGLTLLAVIVVDALFAKHLAIRMPYALPALAMGGTFISLLLLWVSPAQGHDYANYAVTPMGRWWRMAFTLLLLGVQGLDLFSRPATKPRWREGAFQALLLAATLGMFAMVSSREWLTFFIGLELATLPLLALTAFHSQRSMSVEAAIKLTVFAGLAMAFSAFGISLLYGSTGSLSFIAFSQQVHATSVVPAETYRLLGAFFLAGSLLFKVAGFPFQMWAPDVYQGAPFPVMAYLAVASKAAALAAMALLFFGPLAYTFKTLQSAWLILALASQIIGNLGAIRQTRFSRFIAYSSIAQAGFFLLAFLAPTRLGQEALIFNVLAYGFSTLALFFFWNGALKSQREVSGGDTEGDQDDLHGLGGLVSRRPDLALGLAVTLFSLAGIPPLMGFMGKFLLFNGLAKNQHYAVLALALANTVVALYYYAKWVLVAYTAKPDVPAISECSVTAESKRGAEFWIGVGLMAALLGLGALPFLLNALRAIPR